VTNLLVSLAIFAFATPVYAGLFDFIFGKPEVKVTASDLPEAAEKLEKAMAAIDPAGIKKLLAENTELKAKLDKLAGDISSISLGSGVIVLQGNRLQISVPEYRGAFLIDAWIDNQENWVLQARELPDRAYVFPVSLNGVNIFGSGSIRTVQARCQVALKDYLARGNLVPSAQLTKIDLQDQLLSSTSGKHFLYFRVTPVSATAQSDWFLRIRIEQISPDGTKTSIIKETDFSSAQSPKQELGKPCPERVALFSVQTNAR
jgi:hypothetical protein